jgi:hypothetical protein
MAVELELAFAERRLKAGNKLTAEDPTEHLDGKKEGRAGGDPAGVVWSESAGSVNAFASEYELSPPAKGDGCPISRSFFARCGIPLFFPSDSRFT